MKHRHMKIQNGPMTNDALNNVARGYCAMLAKRIRKKRINDNRPNDGSPGFNIPKVVAACTSDVSPYFVCRARNNNNLQAPHSTLAAAYPLLRGNGKPLHQTIPDVDYYPAGHCAEPHAAHTLLLNMEERGNPISIGDIRFSFAFRVKNYSIVPYCGTCRLTFPQLG